MQLVKQIPWVLYVKAAQTAFISSDNPFLLHQWVDIRKAFYYMMKSKNK